MVALSRLLRNVEFECCFIKIFEACVEDQRLLYFRLLTRVEV